jgi:serine acetyltransferase
MHARTYTPVHSLTHHLPKRPHPHTHTLTTLGARALDFNPRPATRPTVGDGVSIGAGAKVLGGIVLGDNCRVGANSVVLSDLPPGCLAVGVPARVILGS